MTGQFRALGSEAALSAVGGGADLASRVRRERTARNWSMGRLVEELEQFDVAIPRSAVKRIEDGEREVKAFELAALAQVFETTMEDLLRPMDSIVHDASTRVVRAMEQMLEVRNELISSWQNFWGVILSKEPVNDGLRTAGQLATRLVARGLAKTPHEGPGSDDERVIEATFGFWIACQGYGRELAGLKPPEGVETWEDAIGHFQQNAEEPTGGEH